MQVGQTYRLLNLLSFLLIMISFCQDLSISHEYHIYENKTIKKVIHKRDGTNISERTFTKASKLQVVSKNLNRKNHASSSEVKVSDSQRNLPTHRAEISYHQRSIFNNFQLSRELYKSNETLIIENPCQKNNNFEFRQVKSIQIPAEIHQLRPQNMQNSLQSHQRPFKKDNISVMVDPIRKSNNIEFREVNSVQMPAAIQQRRAYNMQAFDFKNLKQQKKQFNFFKTPTIHKPFPEYQIQGKPLKESQLTQKYHRNSQKSQQKTVKFGSLIVKLNQSVETKKNSLNSERDFLPRNHSKTNSCSVNQNFTNKIVTYSFIQDYDCESKGLDKYDTINTQNSSKNSPFKDIGTKKCSGFVNFSRPQLEMNKKSEFTQNSRLNEHSIYQGADKLVFSRPYFQQKTRFDNNDNLFDAASIKSYSLKSYQADEQQDSVVEHRSFFFQKEEQPLKMFKKSIEKYIFLQPGHISSCQRWTIFKNVQQKDTRKPYSIKEFSIQNEKIYFDQYQAYLALKIQNHNGQKEPITSSGFILELYNALSNSDEERLYLVKQPFKCILNDHISEMIRKHAFLTDRKQQVNLQKSKVLEQIDGILQFFSLKQLSMKKNQNFQIEDFVVCYNLQNGSTIKFHNLHKLQPIKQNHTNEPQMQSFLQKTNLCTNGSRKINFVDSKGDQQAIQRIQRLQRLQRQKRQDLLIKLENAFENM